MFPKFLQISSSRPFVAFFRDLSDAPALPSGELDVKVRRMEEGMNRSTRRSETRKQWRKSRGLPQESERERERERMSFVVYAHTSLL